MVFNKRVYETLSDELIEGNLTLTASLDDVNATELTILLAGTFNVSESLLTVVLSAGSVQLDYAIRLPNCSEALSAEYEVACEDFAAEPDEESYDETGNGVVDVAGFDAASIEAAIDTIEPLYVSTEPYTEDVLSAFGFWILFCRKQKAEVDCSGFWFLLLGICSCVGFASGFCFLVYTFAFWKADL